MNATTARYCPSCAQRTAERFCPNDGVATLAEGAPLVDSSELRVGDIIDGRYRLLGELGSGGFGAVFAAEHTGTQQRLAIKILRTADAREDEVRRFHQEARITAALNHRNTVRVFDVGQTDKGVLYMAMELLDGETLETLLRGRQAEGLALSEAEAIEVGVPVLKSLEEAHGHRLVHRDLKPANIMLVSDGDDVVVKVLDFGVARTHDSSLTSTTVALGTPAYMSPEQCEGRQLDGRSDLYAMGVILYRCVTGETPFHHSNPLTLMYQQANAPLPPLQERCAQALSADFIACVERALAKDPDERPANARQMRLALESALTGVPDLRTSTPTVALRGLIRARADQHAAASTEEMLPTETYAATPSAPGVVVIDDAGSDDETAAQTPSDTHGGPRRGQLRAGKQADDVGGPSGPAAAAPIAIKNGKIGSKSVLVGVTIGAAALISAWVAWSPRQTPPTHTPESHTAQSQTPPTHREPSPLSQPGAQQRVPQAPAPRLPPTETETSAAPTTAPQHPVEAESKPAAPTPVAARPAEAPSRPPPPAARPPRNTHANAVKKRHSRRPKRPTRAKTGKDKPHATTLVPD